MFLVGTSSSFSLPMILAQWHSKDAIARSYFQPGESFFSVWFACLLPVVNIEAQVCLHSGDRKENSLFSFAVRARAGAVAAVAHGRVSVLGRPS